MVQEHNHPANQGEEGEINIRRFNAHIDYELRIRVVLGVRARGAKEEEKEEIVGFGLEEGSE